MIPVSTALQRDLMIVIQGEDISSGLIGLSAYLYVLTLPSIREPEPEPDTGTGTTMTAVSGLRLGPVEVICG